MHIYTASGLGITFSSTFSDIVGKLQSKGLNSAVGFGGWTASWTGLNFPEGMGLRFYILVYRYDDGYAYADLTDITKCKKYMATIYSAGQNNFENWTQP